MKKVLILVGGPGGEAQVSLNSGRFIFEHFPREVYGEPLVLCVSPDKRLAIFDDYDFVDLNGNTASLKTGLSFFPTGDLTSELSKLSLLPSDVVAFPVLHGKYGEDGGFLSFLDCLGIPYAGFQAAASAIAFDKILTKLVCESQGLPVVPYVWFEKSSRIKSRPFPGADHLFVKPSREGSSLGVYRVATESQFMDAVEQAFLYDSKVLVEPEITGRELECAVLETKEGWISSPMGEIVHQGWYSFEEKYLKSSKTKTVLAELTDSVSKIMREAAIQTVQVLEGNGFARVDFFLDNGGKWYINEINTLPGFTSISMYPWLMEQAGYKPVELIEMIIKQSLWRDS
jgi:D-alanine-D-alanine ligase